MDIKTAMQTVNGLTLYHGHKQLVSNRKEWIVYERKYRQKYLRELIRTTNESDAVEELLRD